MNKPLLSIITPVFNGESHIESCLTSVIDQQCPHAEHIIVDGGSTDKTMDIVRRFAAQHAHIRYISEKDNGQSSAMNKGIALAQGSVLSFLNCDDFYESNVLNRMVKIFEKAPEPTFVAGNCRTWRDDGTVWYINLPTLNIINVFIGGEKNQFPHNPAAYFYHKSLHDKVGLYDESDHYSMDLDFILRAIQGAHLQYYNEIFGNYRFLRGTKTYQAKEANQLDLNVRRKLNQYLRAHPLHVQGYVHTMRFVYVDRVPYFFARGVKRKLMALLGFFQDFPPLT